MTVDRAAPVGTGDCAPLAPAASRVRQHDLIAEVLPGAYETDARPVGDAEAAYPMEAIGVISGAGEAASAR